MNTNYAQYQSLAEHPDYARSLVEAFDAQSQTPEVAECMEQIVTEVITDNDSIEAIRDRIFKPVVVTSKEVCTEQIITELFTDLKTPAKGKEKSGEK